MTQVTSPEQGTREMDRIIRSLPESDGIRWFAWAYQRSRVNVLEAADEGFFGNRTYIRNLDVGFLNQFLSAVDIAGDNPLNLPACWRPSFYERANPRVLPIQHVIAGLIAHIFRDLTLAVFQTVTFWEAPANKLFLTPKWRDYNRVNDVLSRTMRDEVLPALRDQYDSEVIESINFFVEPFLATSGHLSIFGGRTDAWDRGNTMRLTYPLLGDFGGTAQDLVYSAEAGALAQLALLPIIEPVP